MKSTETLTAAVLAILLTVAVGAASPAHGGEMTANPSGEGGESSSPPSFLSGVEGFFKRLGEPERKAAAVSIASSYDPNFNISSLLGSGAVIYDHGYLWDKVKSSNTAFKLEAVAGSMVRPDVRMMVSLNMMALYYPPLAVPTGLRPYLEAGIGVIYTDHRVEGQAYRFLFNPQLGIGTELKAADGSSYFVAMRLHHISNGSINSDNQGVNTLLLQLGKYF